jgi:GNAT superfamily N-acetyltransferase
MSRVFECGCGVAVAGDAIEDLVPLVTSHFDEAHSELGINQVAVRNYLEAEDRLTGPTERLDSIGGIEIRAIGQETLADILAFFDTEAFAGNPAWASCYCMYFPIGGAESHELWANRTTEQNRIDQAARIVGGTTTGVLAYVDGKLAGWCNATTRSQFPGLATGSGDEHVGSIVCFTISPPYREHGVAGHLLDGAISYLWSNGFTRIEGYPAAESPTRDRAFRGTEDLFRSRGFEVVSEDPMVVALQA